MKNTLSSILISTCVIFSILILIICLGIALLGLPETTGPDYMAVISIFVFCLIISGATVICVKSKINAMLNYLLHLLATSSASAVFLKTVNDLEGKTVLISVVAIAIIHSAVFAIIYTVKKSNKKTEKYESIYKKESSK